MRRIIFSVERQPADHSCVLLLRTSRSLCRRVSDIYWRHFSSLWLRSRRGQSPNIEINFYDTPSDESALECCLVSIDKTESEAAAHRSSSAAHKLHPSHVRASEVDGKHIPLAQRTRRRPTQVSTENRKPNFARQRKESLFSRRLLKSIVIIIIY